LNRHLISVLTLVMLITLSVSGCIGLDDVEGVMDGDLPSPDEALELLGQGGDNYGGMAITGEPYARLDYWTPREHVINSGDYVTEKWDGSLVQSPISGVAFSAHISFYNLKFAQPSYTLHMEARLDDQNAGWSFSGLGTYHMTKTWNIDPRTMSEVTALLQVVAENSNNVLGMSSVSIVTSFIITPGELDTSDLTEYLDIKVTPYKQSVPEVYDALFKFIKTDGSPMGAGCGVRLFNNKNYEKKSVTDDQGRVKIINVPSGTYNMEFTYMASDGSIWHTADVITYAKSEDIFIGNDQSMILTIDGNRIDQALSISGYFWVGLAIAVPLIFAGLFLFYKSQYCKEGESFKTCNSRIKKKGR